jgi:transposase
MESAMKNSATVIGLDIAKNSFYAVGTDAQQNEVLKRKLTRGQLLEFFVNLHPAAIGIEACAGAHDWARKLNAMGHDVRLIAGQHVSRRVVGNKNDSRDAQVIGELRGNRRRTMCRSTARSSRTQMLHRARRLVSNRTRCCCRSAACWAGTGGLAKGGGPAQGLAEGLGGEHVSLSPSALETFCDLRSNGGLGREGALDRASGLAEQNAMATNHETAWCRPLTSTALIASLGDARHFRAGRDYAANLGLTPREFSTGGKQRLFGISKRGDRYLRTLLIHGARSALRCAQGKPDRLLQWALRLKEAKGFNVAACALANKLARVTWALIAAAEPIRRSGTTRPRSGG